MIIVVTHALFLTDNFTRRWRNYVVRGIFTVIMISGFGLLIYGGPLALMITVSVIAHAPAPVQLYIFFAGVCGCVLCAITLDKPTSAISQCPSNADISTGAQRYRRSNMHRIARSHRLLTFAFRGRRLVTRIARLSRIGLIKVSLNLFRAHTFDR